MNRNARCLSYVTVADSYTNSAIYHTRKAFLLYVCVLILTSFNNMNKTPAGICIYFVFI